MLRKIDALQAQELRNSQGKWLLKMTSGGVGSKDDKVQPVGGEKVYRYKLLYRCLTAGHARKDVLLTLKRVASQHSCRLSRELNALIDQELMLLDCEVEAAMLDQLRNRLRLAYLRLADATVPSRGELRNFSLQRRIWDRIFMLLREQKSSAEEEIRNESQQFFMRAYEGKLNIRLWKLGKKCMRKSCEAKARWEEYF